MDGTELQPDNTCLQSFPKLPLWIIEYVWAHKMMEIQEVVDPSNWPEVDSQPLNLQDSWRLRVTSARVYSIVRNRDMEHFERVMGFLDATYRLLPRLVAPIKHMKIMFGLKTMVIMRMLREGRGMVDTVLKTSQFFPSKLPQYQGQCSQHEMFLMRKNHLDFKALAQALAMDKDKLEDYIKNQMEEQYGEHYAQKVEDRLMHYLRELETALPGDTYIDKILKKESPVTEEEKLLLEVITSDSANIATTLKKLLHCEVASCRSGSIFQPSAHEKNGMESSQLSKSGLCSSSSAKTPIQLQPEVFRGGEEADQDVPKDGLLLLENDNVSDVSRRLTTEWDGEVVKRAEEDGSKEEKEEISTRSSEGVQQAPSSPQFCSKHQRWVRSILQECPDECSEELLLQANVSLSPPLFQSSSSATSSQDLTPSDIVPCPPDQQPPPSQTSTHLQTAVQASEQANPENDQRSRSPGSASNGTQTELLPLPSSSRDTQPPILSPVVRLIDIASVGRIYPLFKPDEARLNSFTVSSNKQADSAYSPQVRTCPHRHTPGNNAMPLGTMKDASSDQPVSLATTTPPNTACKVQTAPLSQDSSTGCQPPAQFRRACTTTRHSQALDGISQNPLAEQFVKAPTTFGTSCSPLPDFNVSGPPREDASTSTPQLEIPSSVCFANHLSLATQSSCHVVPQNSVKTRPRTHITPLQATTRPCSTAVSSANNPDRLAVRSETGRVGRAQLKLSLPSQAVLLQSKLLQPYVSLNRLSAQECCRVTKLRSCTSCVKAVVQGSNDEERREEEEEEAADSSFDVNTLYSSDSSSSDSEDSLHCDHEYKPRIKKKRLLSE
ncbi:uncharacterized protein LOC129108257 [Anoplopoma fimbria]|uniref:uncharacterized protein LOC129108257 n=1 Tax=Anoplopoma fimbria TaxID=229290 RepID=UPI0023ECF5B1|nr:uncharacterized protein LOC129108257 [Anoplopoma fimbria]